jgi:hypothetical protein
VSPSTSLALALALDATLARARPVEDSESRDQIFVPWLTRLCPFSRLEFPARVSETRARRSRPHVSEVRTRSSRSTSLHLASARARASARAARASP